MVDFENPVARAIFLRFVGPLFPVWLFGAVFVFVLDRYSIAGPSLSDPDLGVLLVVYSLLVAALVSVLYFAEWSRSPTVISLSVDGVSGQIGTRHARSIDFPYASILRIHPAGYFTARVVARSERGAVRWMNLTAENALRLTEAWGAWCERQGTGKSA
jgi:hypothetical protein